MPILWWRRTLVQRLIQDYEDLETRLQRTINTLTTERENFREERISIHNRLTAYDTAEGNIAALFYYTIEENISRFETIHTNLEVIIDDLERKKSEIVRKLGQLSSHRQRELNEDRELTRSEIHLH